VAAGLAVLQAVEFLINVEATIKWPNDVRIRGLKLGGVLVESRVEDGDVEAVVGIGLNLVLDPAEHPDIADTATSLLVGTGQTIPRDTALRAVAARFDHVYRNLLAGRTPIDEWAGKLDTIGSEVTVDFSNGESSISGKAISVTETGELIVERPGGGRTACNAGEVTLQVEPQANRRTGK
jgi:BirA family biotin operon repressor/biotin-[acetyl-CoA-carboxylase] ligase